MRVDWEGEVIYKGLNLYVHADYNWDYDCYDKHVIVVTKAKAWSSETEEFEIDQEFKDYVADIIQDELENAA